MAIRMNQEDGMTKEESSKIKDEILNLNGSICICGVVTVENVVHIDDVLKIITKYTSTAEERTGVTFGSPV